MTNLTFLQITSTLSSPKVRLIPSYTMLQSMYSLEFSLSCLLYRSWRYFSPFISPAGDI